MKVILFENVENLGSQGAIVSVAPGYFRNFLSPRGFAVEATETNQRSLEAKMRKLLEKSNEERKAAQGLADRIAGTRVTFVMKSGDDSKLFGSVTNVNIAEELAKAGFEVDRRHIVLPEPIKRLGTHSVDVKIHHDVVAQIVVVVEKEGVAAEAPVAEVAPEEEA